MGKVVTSAGLTEFVQEGKTTHVPDHKSKKPNEAAPLEMKAETVAAQPPEAREPAKPPEKAKEEPDEALTDEEKALPDKAQKEIQRAKRAVNAKHKEMREAKEAAEEAERFAEQQYNERRLADNAREAAEQKLKDLESKTLPKPQEEKEPDEKDAQFYDEKGQFLWQKFSKALAKFEAAEAVKAERVLIAKQAAEREQEALGKRIKASADKAREAHSDFDKVMMAVKDTEADQQPQFVLNYILESDNSAEVAYYLATHPEDSRRIAKLSPIKGIAELGKVEDKLSVKPSAAAIAPAVNGATPPPAPITPLTGDGTAGITTDPSKMSYKELRAYERERSRAKH